MSLDKYLLPGFISFRCLLSIRRENSSTYSALSDEEGTPKINAETLTDRQLNNSMPHSLSVVLPLPILTSVCVFVWSVNPARTWLDGLLAAYGEHA